VFCTNAPYVVFPKPEITPLRTIPLVNLALRFVRDFARANGGATAIIFALSAVTLVTTGGVGVDIARALVVKNRMASALDAAGLAVGTANGLNQAEMQALAQKYFDANFNSMMGTAAAVQVSVDGDKISLSVSGAVPTSLMNIAGISTMAISAKNEVSRGALNLEVSLALDVTGSMAGQKIIDLRAAAKELVDIVVQDVQTPYYSKVALAPYSMGVNVGSYAAQVRGPIAAGKTITSATWANGTAKNISAITKANPGRVTTSSSHGLTTGDRVYIKGVNGMTQINNKEYTITRISNTQFTIGVSTSGYSNYSNSGNVTECLTSSCEVVVTASSHGFSNGAEVVIDSVNGMTQINSGTNETWTVASAATNTFVLSGSDGPAYGTYTSGGKAYCTTAGCQFYRFTNASWSPSIRVFEVSSCVTERTGSNAYTDAAPSTAYLGRNYPAPGNPCLTNTIQPLSTSRASLKSQIDSLQAQGSTAGHTGIAWAWYLVSPNFAYLWPGASQPANYGADKLLKVVVIMTDGAFNSPYCNGVISEDALSGSGSVSDHINCNAPNGSVFSQGQNLCTKMKAEGVVVYTVGFDVAGDQQAESLMESCASDSSRAYIAASGTALKDAFISIAQDINSLRLSK